PDLAGVGRGHVGPEREVAHRRRTVGPEIPPEELEFRLLHRQVVPVRKPLLRTNEGCLGPAGRTETREPPKARQEDNPVEGQHLARDSKPGRGRCATPTSVRLLDTLDAEGGGDPLGNLATRERSIEPIPHRFDQSVDGVDRHPGADEPGRGARVPPGAATDKHREISGRDEVQRAADAPRFHECPVTPPRVPRLPAHGGKSWGRLSGRVSRAWSWTSRCPSRAARRANGSRSAA